jgi:hypothetical protein
MLDDDDPAIISNMDTGTRRQDLAIGHERSMQPHPGHCLQNTRDKTMKPASSSAKPVA